MIIPQNRLDVFQHYPAFRDLSGDYRKSQYKAQIAREDLKDGVKVMQTKKSAGVGKHSTAKNAQ